jgi:N-methylhydantoinase B
LPAALDAQGKPRQLSLSDEGICIPPTIFDESIIDRVAAASRTPSERRGDLAAQSSANERGAKLLSAYVGEIGLDEFQRLNEGLLSASEKRMKALLSSWPEGVFEVSDGIDLANGSALELRLILRLQDGHVEVDLSAFPDALDEPLNAPRAVALAACFYTLRALAGDEVPANAGMLRCLRLITRPGSLLEPPPQAPVSAGNVETSQRLVDLLFAAFRSALPGRVPAASAGTMSNLLLSGRHPQTGRRFVHYETIAGGAGGGPDGAGADAIQTHMTNTLNTPVERLEQEFPLLVERYALRPLPATTERHAGGCGVVRSLRFLVPTEVTLMAQRHGQAPGQPGRADVDGTPIAGQATLRLDAGQTLTIETPSGAGWSA